MTRDVATVSLHADGSEAAAIMARRLVRRLPVVDELQHIYGVVTLDDLLRHLGSDADRLADTVLMQSRHFAIP
jgi:CBS domain-containing membrane protein